MSKHFPTLYTFSEYPPFCTFDAAKSKNVHVTYYNNCASTTKLCTHMHTDILVRIVTRCTNERNMLYVWLRSLTCSYIVYVCAIRFHMYVHLHFILIYIYIYIYKRSFISIWVAASSSMSFNFSIRGRQTNIIYILTLTYI